MKKKITIYALVVSFSVAGGFASPSFADKNEAKRIEVNEIHDNPQKWVGKKVTLKGEVEELAGTGVFRLNGDGIINDEILVVKPKGSKQVVNEDDELQVTGTVRQLNVVDIERGYGWDFDPEIRVELEDKKLYLVADSIQVLERD